MTDNYSVISNEKINVRFGDDYDSIYDIEVNYIQNGNYKIIEILEENFIENNHNFFMLDENHLLYDISDVTKSTFKIGLLYSVDELSFFFQKSDNKKTKKERLFLNKLIKNMGMVTNHD